MIFIFDCVILQTSHTQVTFKLPVSHVMGGLTVEYSTNEKKYRLFVYWYYM